MTVEREDECLMAGEDVHRALYRAERDRGAQSDRANRAVAEQVLDARTRLVLLRLINRGVLDALHGCISTGKEANVYHGVGGAVSTADVPDLESAFDFGSRGPHCAVKIYKSTVLTFRAREQYVSGEFRFRAGYARGNPRRMVRQWAEKETRNLRRLRAAGVPCPRPLLLRQHVLVMDLIGEVFPDGRAEAAPRLKDADMDAATAAAVYHDLVRAMRSMYHACRLVHADLSEYNVLLWRGRPVVIDVAQAVEHDHPRALDFLRKDCANVVSFFRSRGVATLDVRRLFDLVTDVSLPVPCIQRRPPVGGDYPGGYDLSADGTTGPDGTASNSPTTAASVLSADGTTGPDGTGSSRIDVESVLSGEGVERLRIGQQSNRTDAESVLSGEGMEGLRIGQESNSAPEYGAEMSEVQRAAPWFVGYGHLYASAALEAHIAAEHAAAAAEADGRSAAEADAARVDEAVFLRAYIPRTLGGIIDAEAELDGDASGALYRKLTGLHGLGAGSCSCSSDSESCAGGSDVFYDALESDGDATPSGVSASDSDSDSESDSAEDTPRSVDATAPLTKEERRAQRKKEKAAVKEANRERRRARALRGSRNRRRVPRQ